MVKIKKVFLTVIIITMTSNIFVLFHAYRFTHPIEKSIYDYKDYNSPLQKIRMVSFGIPPIKSKMSITPSDFNLSYFNVSFITIDNIKLHSWFIPANKSKGTILLVHGYGGNKAALMKYAISLNKNNYNTLLLDLRASGLSEGSSTSLGYYEKHDIKASIDFLKNNNIENFGALGFSVGGVALLSYLKENKNDIKSAIIVGVYDNIYDAVARRIKIVYGLPKFPFATILTYYGGIILNFNAFELVPEKFISDVNTPLLIIDEQNYNLTISSEIGTLMLVDKNNKLHSAEDALKLYKNANFPKEIFIVVNETTSKEYEEKIVSFFDKYLMVS